MLSLLRTGVGIIVCRVGLFITRPFRHSTVRLSLYLRHFEQSRIADVLRCRGRLETPSSVHRNFVFGPSLRSIPTYTVIRILSSCPPHFVVVALPVFVRATDRRQSVVHVSPVLRNRPTECLCTRNLVNKFNTWFVCQFVVSCDHSYEKVC